MFTRLVLLSTPNPPNPPSSPPTPSTPQVVLTTVEPQDGRKGSAYDAYEYTAHSHTFMSDQVPSVRLTYDMSPIQVSHGGGELACWRACWWAAGHLLLHVCVCLSMHPTLTSSVCIRSPLYLSALNSGLRAEP